MNINDKKRVEGIRAKQNEKYKNIEKNYKKLFVYL